MMKLLFLTMKPVSYLLLLTFLQTTTPSIITTTMTKTTPPTSNQQSYQEFKVDLRSQARTTICYYPLEVEEEEAEHQ